jgi:hypothetical protein
MIIKLELSIRETLFLVAEKAGKEIQSCLAILAKGETRVLKNLDLEIHDTTITHGFCGSFE